MRSVKKGLTLIELIVALVIGAIILIPTATVVVGAVTGSLYPGHFSVASFLLEREIERVSVLRFSEVADEGPTNYSGNLSYYAYEVSFYYVDAGALNTQVVGPTDYKRVTVTISRTGFPSVSAVTLVTSY